MDYCPNNVIDYHLVSCSPLFRRIKYNIFEGVGLGVELHFH